MAESSWWEGWVSSAKSKSAEIVEFVRRDIGEISSAVKTEATTIVGQAKDAVKESLQLDKEESTANVVKKSLSSFFEQISEALVPTGATDDDDSFVPLIVQNGSPVELSPFQLKLYEMINDEKTFTEPITGDESHPFDSWLTVSADLVQNVDRLSNLLAHCAPLNAQYAELVPIKVSHSDFWKRYLFRRAVLEDSEAEERIRLKKLSGSEEKTDTDVIETATEADVKSTDPNSFKWEKENNFGPNIDLTEEEQIRLLTEYEKEKKAKQDVTEEEIKVQEKSDLVIVGPNAEASSKESSSDGDWEKDFELEEKN